jgi:hypothetical protein
MKFPTIKEMAEEVAEKALDEFEYKGKTLRQWIDAIYAASESFEWCDGCKEYDQEQHCCHRFTKVIRQAVAEMKVVHCIDCQHSEYDSVYGERWCHYNGKAEVVDDYHFCRDGERKDDKVTCDNCEYSEKYVDGLILCRRTKTSHRVSATSTCGKGKREVEDAEAKI